MTAFGQLKAIFLCVFLFVSSVTHAVIIHEFDVAVSEDDFRGPDFYGVNSLRNPNDIFYKYLYVDPFTINSGEQHTFLFNLDQTIWLYDLGLPYAEDEEIVGTSILLDGSLGDRDLHMDLYDVSINLIGLNAQYDLLDWSYVRGDGGYGGVGISPSAWTNITNDAIGIDKITITFSADNVDYDGGSDMFDDIRLSIIGDHVSLEGPISVNAPSSLLLLVSGLLLLRRKIIK